MAAPAFNAAAPPSDAEMFLKTEEIPYKKQADGTLYVPGSIDLSERGLTMLPDLSQITVGGDFYCGKNRLTSLKGAPQSVLGRFRCHMNELTTLEGAPRNIGKGFFCRDNRLTTLRGGPQTVGENFFCSDNQLTSLEGAPNSVGGMILCDNNPMTSLAGAPRNFKTLGSGLGNFASYAAIPEDLLITEEARAAEEERLRMSTSPALQRPLRVPKALKF